MARRHCLVSTLCVVLSRISRSINRFFATLHRRCSLLHWLWWFLLTLNRLCPQVAKLISPAGGGSPAFVRGFLELLQCPHTVAALRGDHARQDKSAVFSWLDGVDTTRFGAVSID